MRDEEFESFVRRSRRPMVRTATALTVGDPHLAEDVVQRALVKLYLAWPRVRTMNVDAYARRVLVTTFVDERRRPFLRRESVVRDVPDRPDGDVRDEFEPELVAALRTLPRGMRSIVVLRYVENLTVEETAETVGCSTGNVKSQAARGLAKLRSELGRPTPTVRTRHHRPLIRHPPPPEPPDLKEIDMQDLTERLARLNAPAGGLAPSDGTVAADLSRGQRALRRRTARRAGVGVVGVAAAAAAVTVAMTGGRSDHAAPRAAGQHPPVASSHSHPSPAHHGQKPAIELVAYHGAQKPGFTVQYVPDGYVLQGVSGSTLDIATADDHTPLDTFSGKLTVGAEQATDGQGLEAYHGTPVTINGEPGIVGTDKYATTVVFEQGGGSDNIVTVQCWSNIELTQDQVVDFAKGVTVTADVQRQHG